MAGGLVAGFGTLLAGRFGPPAAPPVTTNLELRTSDPVATCEELLRELRFELTYTTGYAGKLTGPRGAFEPDWLTVSLRHETTTSSGLLAKAEGCPWHTARSPARFVPDPQDLQRQIDQTLAESEGRRYLVGAWHTHPLGRPKLSRTDRGSIRRVAATPAVGIAQPVAIVLAPTRGSRRAIELGAWVWSQAGAKVAAANIQDFC
jgi:proteasome lid subunit RPN8/RPN11